MTDKKDLDDVLRLRTNFDREYLYQERTTSCEKDKEKSKIYLHIEDDKTMLIFGILMFVNGLIIYLL